METLEASVQGKTNTASKGSEDAPYFIEIADGFGTKIKVINFENPGLAPFEGHINLIPIVTTSRHENKASLRKAYDRKNGVIIGIPNFINPESKQWEYLKIQLTDSESYDLSDPLDRKKWIVLKHSRFVEGSPYASPNKREITYRVEDKNKEAELFLARRTAKRKAETLADGLFGENLIDMARVLGFAVENMSTPILHKEVIEFAEKNPVKFIELYDSPTRPFAIVLKRALATGVITNAPPHGIMYGAIPIGVNEQLAINYLQEYPQISQAIDMLSRKQESDSVKAMAKRETIPVKDEKDAILAQRDAEIQALNERLKALTTEKITGQLDTDLQLSSLKDEELESLRLRAKALGVKNPGVYGKEKLTAKVKELEAEAK